MKIRAFLGFLLPLFSLKALAVETIAYGKNVRIENSIGNPDIGITVKAIVTI